MDVLQASSRVFSLMLYVFLSSTNPKTYVGLLQARINDRNEESTSSNIQLRMAISLLVSYVLVYSLSRSFAEPYLVASFPLKMHYSKY